MPRAMSSALAIMAVCWAALAQTEQAYEQTPAEKSTSLLDASRFSVHQSLSFGMLGSSTSDLKSQSLYGMMVQYRFAKPVTLNLNFGLPLYSTYSSDRNLTLDNLQSLDYFKSMPWDVSLDWQPKDNLLFRLTVARRSAEDCYSLGSPFHYNTLDEAWEGLSRSTSAGSAKSSAK